MTVLNLIFILILLVWIWNIGQTSRDKAVATARHTCLREGVQFLDGTAALQSVKPAWSRNEGPVLQRTYTFDYSEDGMCRRTGCIIMRNTRIITVLLDG